MSEHAPNPLVRAENSVEDERQKIRPHSLQDFIGQTHVKENLGLFIKAAKKRAEAMDHVLFFGPPGLGKTTLSQIISKELNVGFKATSGPVLTKAGDLAAILTNLQPKDVLFIDEIHRLPSHVEEVLYPAMEDFELDIMIGEGPSARSVRINLPPFTLVAATTRAGLLTNPLRERFGIPLHLEFYTPEELTIIVKRGAHILGTKIDAEGSYEIAKRSRGTPRVAGRLMRRVRDFAAVANVPVVTKEIASEALSRLHVDEKGLDEFDRRYLRLLAENYKGGPCGVETLAAALGNERDVLEEVVEPFLMQQGLIQRTNRGRMLCEHAWSYLGYGIPENCSDKMPLFDIKNES